jgi:glycosidase
MHGCPRISIARVIVERLDYIKNLGCTAIWISPFVKNRIDRGDTYHGYGAQDFLQVDPRFGTLDDLRALTAAAHAQGMYVIADIVLNHTGDVWSYPNGDRYYVRLSITYQSGMADDQGWCEV